MNLLKIYSFTTKNLLKAFVVLALFSLSSCGEDSEPTEQIYQVKLTNYWNSTNFGSFPTNGAYGKLIIIGHKSDYTLFSDSTIATSGLRVLAESSDKTNLDVEINAAKSKSYVNNFISQDATSDTKTYSFTMHKDYPYLSMVISFTPSSDWFLGVNSAELYRSDKWESSFSRVLTPYDAGTVNGTAYDSSADQTPQVNVSVATADALKRNNGTFNFMELSITKN